jgi:hypothetical protein
MANAATVELMVGINLDIALGSFDIVEEKNRGNTQYIDYTITLRGNSSACQYEWN